MPNPLNQIIGIVITSVQGVHHHVSRTVIKGPPPHSTFQLLHVPTCLSNLTHLLLVI